MKQVDVPTLTGAFGILPAHVPTLQVLRPGVVTVFNDDGSAVKYFGKILHYKSVTLGPVSMYSLVPPNSSEFIYRQIAVNDGLSHVMKSQTMSDHFLFTKADICVIIPIIV